MRIAPGAVRYAVAAALAGLATARRLGRRAAVALALLLAGAVLAFHRDPERTPPDDGAVAPADGVVSVVRTEEHDGDARVRVGIYMNAANVHVNRAPLPGTVASIEHIDGGHRLAFSKDSEHNERVHVDIAREADTDEATDDGDYRVTLIAGAFARRIHPYVEAGQPLARGERIGHISFGSRADVLLPAGVTEDEVLVEAGETTRAGETRIADV
ncbi:protein sorting system archaetidylserine decarboxylase [Haloglomus litoreum]|uniref:protein sorting system archaetidylserine decarboxylase n=1 Tax=Haloglomus litoreum TaxID=3034026 RepID=UPI0023E8E901|nr:protein sorting system archaetidylserine decarboxylase [Haloglomus sp. DT116]